LSGEVQVVAAFEPSYLRLGRIPVGAIRTETVKVTAKDPAGLKITGLKPSNPDRIEARVVQGKQGTSIEVKIKAGEKEGRMSESVVATTNLKSPKEIRLHISGTVSKDLWADPPRVFFAGFDKRSLPTTVVKVASLSGAKFQLKGVTDKTGAVSGQVEHSDKGWKVVLSLKNKPESNAGMLQIRTDSKKQPIIEVPYTVGMRSRTRRGARNAAIRGKALPKAIPGISPKPVRRLMRRPPPGKTK